MEFPFTSDLICKAQVGFLQLPWPFSWYKTALRESKEEKPWDKTNKELTSFYGYFLFCLRPVLFLLSSIAVLYHVNDQLQKAYWGILKLSVMIRFSYVRWAESTGRCQVTHISIHLKIDINWFSIQKLVIACRNDIKRTHFSLAHTWVIEATYL